MPDQNNWQQPPSPQNQPAYAPPTPQPIPAVQPAVYSQQPVYGYAAPAPVQQKKSKTWIVVLVTIILFFVLCTMAIDSCSRAFSVTSSLGSSSSSELLLSDGVGVINIDGAIEYDGTTSSPEGLKAQLDRAQNNPHIKAVVLRVNSGGGTATAGEEMATYVRDFSKPVVVSSAAINASAAYEISSQADYIFTAKTTAIGAVGTVMQVTDLSELLAKLGIKVDNIASAESKDSSYGTRPLSEEERAYYQRQIDQINETFIQTVADGRGMGIEAVRPLATGLTFTGMDAVDNGLADKIGTFEEACAKAYDLAGMAGPYETVYLQDKSTDLSGLLSLLGSSSSASSNEQIISALKELTNNGISSEQ